MTDETTPKKRRKVTISSVLILLLIVAICAFGVFRLSVKWKLKAGIEAIRAAGYPATGPELDAWYTIPRDAQNAAQTILDALSFIREWDKDDVEPLPLVGRAELPARTEPLSDQTKDLIAKYVADNNEAIELLHTAAKIEHCRYPVDFSAGFAARLDHLPNMRKAAMLLNLEAMLHADNGQADPAVRSIQTGFGLARSLTKEPCTISQLVRAACIALSLKGLERVVNRIDLSDEQLIELSEYLSEAERASDMSCAFVGERCMGLSFFTAPTSADIGLFNSVPARPVLLLWQAIGLADMDGAIYLDIMKDQLKAARLPYPERQKAAEAVSAKVASTSKIHILVHAIAPALSRVIVLELRAIAHLQVGRVGLAVQRYRLAAGTLPDTLSQLVPTYLDAVPEDPFDGKDLRYKKRAAGFVVYSIGDDGTDDGGAEQLPSNKRPKGQPAPNWDVTFIVER
ncbi:MAG: hypothetical protein P8Z79_02080 [Sedimentisphaerales bacterium]